MSTVRVECHLIVGQSFNNFGFQVGKPSVRVSKGKPTLEKNEVAIALDLRLPESLFKRPQLQAQIVVNDTDAPSVITPEIQENIAQVVKDQLGITLTISGGEAA